MRFFEKGLFLKLGLTFSLIHVLLYLPVHLAYQDFVSDADKWVQIALGVWVSFAAEIASFVLPLVASAVLFISYAYKGAAHALLRVFVFALPYFISALPENYLTFLNYFDSKGAVFFALLFAVITVISVAAEILVLFGVIAFFYRFPKDKRFDAKVTLELEVGETFDFSNRFAKGALMASLLIFAVKLITEIVSTVSYIVDARGNFMTDEIVTVIATYVFLAAAWVVSYVITFKAKKRIIEYRLDETIK